MNITQLKYAIEIEKTRSITSAAQNLFLSQPNLSKAVKELESEISMQIFQRSAKGVKPTREGSKFLSYARTVVSQMENLEAMYKSHPADDVNLTFCIPRATYLSFAFSDFLNTLADKKRLSINIKERNYNSAINYVVNGEANMGVIRYRDLYENYFMALLEEKGLECKLILEYEPRLLMSEKHPLAGREDITEEELSQYTELVHGDIQRDTTLIHNTESGMSRESADKRIYLYERGGQLDILQNVVGTYMWVSPMPSEYLKRHGLVEKKWSSRNVVKKDVLIYRKGHIFSADEKTLISCIKNIIKKKEDEETGAI